MVKWSVGGGRLTRDAPRTPRSDILVEQQEQWQRHYTARHQQPMFCCSFSSRRHSCMPGWQLLAMCCPVQPCTALYCHVLPGAGRPGGMRSVLQLPSSCPYPGSLSQQQQSLAMHWEAAAAAAAPPPPPLPGLTSNNSCCHLPKVLSGCVALTSRLLPGHQQQPPQQLTAAA
jgi:hypothetical protein